MEAHNIISAGRGQLQHVTQLHSLDLTVRYMPSVLEEELRPHSQVQQPNAISAGR